RPVPAIAPEAGRRFFIHRVDRNDAVDRPQRLVGGGRNAQRKRGEILHRLRRTDAGEGPSHEKSGAQPTITVVPGAAGSRSLGNGGGMGRDDPAGFLEIAELKRDRSADDFILPIVGNGETPRPIHPIVDGAVAEFAAGGFEFVLKALVHTTYHSQYH